MADPWNIAGVSLQAAKIAWSIWQFIGDARTAPENIRKAHEIVASVEETLKRVGDLLKYRQNPGPPELKHHRSINKIITQLGNALRALESQMPDLPRGEGVLHKFRGQLEIVLGQNVVKQQFDRTSQCLMLLQLDISMLSIYSTWQVEKSTKRIEELLGEQQKRLQEVRLPDAKDRLQPRDEFAKVVEQWNKTADEVVESVVDTASHRSPQSTIHDHDLGSLKDDITQSEGGESRDSGVDFPDLRARRHLRPAAAYSEDFLSCIMRETQSAAAEFAKRGMFQKAVETQKDFIRYREQLCASRPLRFSERCEMEEILVSMYLEMKTVDSREEATKILEKLLDREARLAPDEKNQLREARLCHQLSKILLESGSDSDIRDAKGYAFEAFNARVAAEPRPVELVKESAQVLYQILVKISPIEAQGLDRYTTEYVGFSVKEDPSHGEALMWCKKMGFDAEQEGFRFDICDASLQPPLNDMAPLHLAVKSKVEGILEHMLNATVNLEVEEQEDLATPLLIACTNKDKLVVRLLLERGAKADARDRVGRTGLHRCQSAKGGTAVAGLLLDHEEGRHLLNATDNMHQTALHMAAKMGNTEMVDLLLSKQADPNVDALGEGTALMAAIRAKMQGKKQGTKARIVERLLESGADPWRQHGRESAMSLCQVLDRQLFATMNKQGLCRRPSITSTYTTISTLATRGTDRRMGGQELSMRSTGSNNSAPSDMSSSGEPGRKRRGIFSRPKVRNRG